MLWGSHRFLDGLFDGDLHAKRILSLTNVTLGVIKTASLAVNTIGRGLALARGLVLVALWKYVTVGVVVEGAVLKADS